LWSEVWWLNYMSDPPTSAPWPLPRTVSTGDSERLNRGLVDLAGTFLFAPMRTRIDDWLAENSPWCPAIQQMLAAGYPFNTIGYDRAGCLFRACRAGFLEMAEQDAEICIRDSRNGKHSATFERVFDVQFLSHEVSDALTASDLLDASAATDNAIVVINAAQFADANRQGNAASLSVGDAGQVRFQQLKRQQSPLCDRLIGVVNQDRASQEKFLRRELRRRGLKPAAVNNDALKPTRSTVNVVPTNTSEPAPKIEKS